MPTFRSPRASHSACSILSARAVTFARVLLILFAVTGGLSAPLRAADASNQSTGKQKNIVLIVTDDQGLDAGCYGHPLLKTPHLDALAARGTRFANAFCTTASCSASRSVLLSGLYSHANGQYGLAHAEHNFHSRPFVRGLPLLLKEAGYRTCIAGKHHVIPESQYAFETVVKANPRSTVDMAARVQEYLQQKDDRPFFVYYCPTDPHRAQKGFANEQKYPGVTEVQYDPAQITVPSFLPDNSDTRRDLAEYFQAISRVDQGLGRLMQALEQTGHADDTLVIYLSDNGSPFPGAKTTQYDAGIHLPLVMYRPGQKAGVVSQALVSWVDITPTILDYAGAKPPKYPLQGKSILPVMEQAEPAGWDEIYGSHTFHEVTMYYPMRTIRTKRHKLIWNLASPLSFPFASDLWQSPTWQSVARNPQAMYGFRTVQQYQQRPEFELYDVQADPEERTNLASRPESAAILTELRSRLKSWQERTNDPWIVKYEHE